MFTSEIWIARLLLERRAVKSGTEERRRANFSFD
jgi:hypothetical protein